MSSKNPNCWKKFEVTLKSSVGALERRSILAADDDEAWEKFIKPLKEKLESQGGVWAVHSWKRV